MVAEATPRETVWDYDQQRDVYGSHIGQCVLTVWQDTDGLWSISIESGRRHALRTGFVTLQEAQAWGEHQAATITAVDRRHERRAS